MMTRDSQLKLTAAKRALSVPEFCATYGIGRTKVYGEIKAGRLKIRKAGRRTIIAHEDGETWFEACASPTTSAATTADEHDAAADLSVEKSTDYVGREPG